MNEALGGRGTTFDLIDPVAHEPTDQAAALRALIADMHGGQVSHLLMIDTNPVFTAPAAWGFAEALEQVPFSVALAAARTRLRARAPGSSRRRTTGKAGAMRARTTAPSRILQPQALPLYGGMSAHEFLALFLGPDARIGRGVVVRATWKAHWGRFRESAGAMRSPKASSPAAASAESDVRLRADAAQSRASAAAPDSGSRSCFVPTRAFGMGATPIIPGCRNCRVR